MFNLWTLIQSKFAQIILAVCFSLFAGTILTSHLPFQSAKLMAGLSVIYLVVLIGVWHLRKQIASLSLPALLLYLLIISSFLGAAVFNIQVGPISLFPYRMIYLMLLFVTAIFIAQNRIQLDFRRVKVKPALLFHLFWVVYAIASLSWSRSLKMGALSIIFLGIGISLIFFIVFFFQEQSHFRHLFYIWIGMFLLLVAIGLWNHVTHLYLPVSRMKTAPADQHGIPTAVFVNENDFASFIAVSFFLLLSFVHRAKHLAFRWIGAVFLILSLYILLLTSSRANFIAVCLGMGFWFLFLASRRAKIGLMVIGLAGGVLLSAIYTEKVLEFIHFAKQIVDSLMIGPAKENASVDIRSNLIKNGLLFFQQSFGFGIGPGNAEFYMGHFGKYPTAGIVNVHNWWVEILVNYGMAVFVGYILLYAWIICRLILIFKQARGCDRMISEGLIGGMIAFSLSCISPSSQIALNYLWLLFAFAIGFINYWRIKHEGVVYGQRIEKLDQ